MGFPRHADFEDDRPIRWLLDFLNPAVQENWSDFAQDGGNVGCMECHQQYWRRCEKNVLQPATERPFECIYVEPLGPAIFVPWGQSGHIFACEPHCSGCRHSTIR